MLLSTNILFFPSFDANRVSGVGYGETMPLDANDNSASDTPEVKERKQNKNRRTVIKFRNDSDIQQQ